MLLVSHSDGALRGSASTFPDQAWLDSRLCLGRWVLRVLLSSNLAGDAKLLGKGNWRRILLNAYSVISITPWIPVAVGRLAP